VPLFNEAMSLSRDFQDLRLQHVLRSENKRADFLANLAVDAGVQGSVAGPKGEGRASIFSNCNLGKNDG